MMPILMGLTYYRIRVPFRLSYILSRRIITFCGGSITTIIAGHNHHPPPGPAQPLKRDKEGQCLWWGSINLFDVEDAMALMGPFYEH